MDESLRRAFGWLAEHDLMAEADRPTITDMRGEWEGLCTKHDITFESLQASVRVLFEILHELVTDAPALFESTGALLGAQGVYAMLIRGVFGREYAAWQGSPHRGVAEEGT